MTNSSESTGERRNMACVYWLFSAAWIFIFIATHSPVYADQAIVFKGEGTQRLKNLENAKNLAKGKAENDIFRQKFAYERENSQSVAFLKIVRKHQIRYAIDASEKGYYRVTAFARWECVVVRKKKKQFSR